MPFLLFYITHPDEATARQIANTLVERRLAACANIFPISSAYWWQGAVQQESEWVSLVKTRLELEITLEKAVQELHPYEVPCIMRLEVRANEAYEKWVEESTIPPVPAASAAE
ncbi:MAG TPA: divalent-cation tolerance protein CutA [Saprospirales bacterium]|nr:divalent-cation tolerance protein CutA [Saprospirales bacterium]